MVPYGLAEWLSNVVVQPDAASADGLLYASVLGYERLGFALDRVLYEIRDDTPRHAGVLRAELRREGEIDFTMGGNGTEVYMMGMADFHEVATALPRGAGVDDEYGWIGLWTSKNLQTANGDLSLYGDLVYSLVERLDPDVALILDGPFDKLAKAIATSLSKEEVDDYMELSKKDAAEELSTWARYALPFPAELGEYGVTRAASLLSLRRLLRESSCGQALLITPINVATVIQHHGAAKLVIGNNVGGQFALNMVIELLRLSLRTNVTPAALTQLATGMAAFNDLLPALRSERVAGLPPNDRLAYVAKELALWDKADRSRRAAAEEAAAGRRQRRATTSAPAAAWATVPYTKERCAAC